MGKKGFLSFPIAPFFSTLFPVFGHFDEKRVKKVAERRNIRLERCGERPWGPSFPFQILEFGEIPFLYGLKLLFVPFKSRY